MLGFHHMYTTAQPINVSVWRGKLEAAGFRVILSDYEMRVWPVGHWEPE
jgi:hypothetical protein